MWGDAGEVSEVCVDVRSCVWMCGGCAVGVCGCSVVVVSEVCVDVRSSISAAPLTVVTTSPRLSCILFAHARTSRHG
jgi:hypothetical protein